MKITLLNSADFKSYSLSMLEALLSKGIYVDLIGNDDLRTAEIMADEKVNFLNLRGDQTKITSMAQKAARVCKFYFRLLKYAAGTDSQLFHMQTHNKFALFDRTLLNLYYKLLGKKLVLTAHNIDAKQRDGGNNIVNRFSLKFSYRLMDHILVHTEKMRTQLIEEFNVCENKITIIPHGILNTTPDSGLSRPEARSRLQLDSRAKALLFFGNIAPYKGLEYLIHALGHLSSNDDSFRLIIAGQIKDCQSYWEDIERLIEELDLEKYIIRQIRHIPDDEVEVYFKSSDVLVLPYKFIFQSGVPFLSYSFGLPVIAADVGSLREVVVEGRTGMICKKEDPADLSDKIRSYFHSDLYTNLEDSMKKIKSYGNETFSWDGIGTTIQGVYTVLLA